MGNTGSGKVVRVGLADFETPYNDDAISVVDLKQINPALTHFFGGLTDENYL